MIQLAILEKLEVLPESMQAEVLHYIEFLLEKHQKNKVNSLDKIREDLKSLSAEEAEKRYGYGSMAGQIIMSEDFDEPLEELAEYM
jgi:adenylosuccinate lyase